MALSPYKTPQSPLNRSRSSSCSSPIRNHFVFQQILSDGSNTLVRSYSCDQVFDKDGNGKTFQTTQIHVASFITPEKKIRVKSQDNTPKTPPRLALEPPPDTVGMGKKKNKRRGRPSVLKAILKRTMMFTLLSVSTAFAFYFYMSYRQCSYVWDLGKTETELKQNIYGQNDTLTRINSILRTCNGTNDMYVMIFSGGVGVGKTYASSIISKNFPWSSYKLVTYSEFFAADVNKVLSQKLATCGTNLVVVDDLSVESVKDAVNFVILLNNERKNNENLLIILIFQVPVDSDTNQIISEFKNAYISVYHVPFKPLTEDAVESCFKSEIERQGVEISNAELKKLVHEKMKYIDIVKGPSGCKGVAEEVASYYKKRQN